MNKNHNSDFNIQQLFYDMAFYTQWKIQVSIQYE